MGGLKLNEKAEIIHGKKRVFTDIVIAAHQDDIEIMCPEGIIKGYQNDDYGLVAVVVTNGSGSPRKAKFESYTDAEMMKVRREEQISAARLGGYSELIFLNYASAEIKDAENGAPVRDIEEILRYYKPQTAYIHNLADKHPTHVKTALKCIEAMRRVEKKPEKLYGCEVWRGLDWLPDSEKIISDVSGYDGFLDSLLAVYESQNTGKRYDLAAAARRVANATFCESHSADKCSRAAYSMDLTPLVTDTEADIKKFVADAAERFKKELLSLL